MLKKILLTILVFVVVANISFGQALTNAQKQQLARIEYRVKMIGDALVGERVDGKSIKGFNPIRVTWDNLGPKKIAVSNGYSAWTITYTWMGGITIYDLQSNGSTQQIWQDPVTPDNIHSVLTHSPPGDPSFTVRLTKYFFSSDRGQTWSFVADAPGGVRTGFNCITGTSEGIELIGNHGANGGSPTRSQFYYDAIAGLGSFTLLDPPAYQSNGYIWPRVVATLNVTLPNKFVFVGSINGQDTTLRNYGTSLSTSSFGTWTAFNSDQAETYSLAVSSSGKIGILYKANDVWNPADYGDVYFIESTDNGSTFSTPLKIFKANFATDSLGMIRGLSLVYNGDQPKAVFETIKQTTEGNYYPGAPAKIRFWSTNLPGSDPNRSIVIADTSMVGWHPNFGVNDVFGTLCRPSIGRSQDGQALFCVFMVPSDEAGGAVDTTPYRDIWATASGDNGLTWKPPIKINFTSPRRDWTYPSVSPTNDQDANNFYFNISVQVDSIPGSYVNGQANGESQARNYFVRVQIPKSELIGVKNISSEIPDNFALYQNYPNPFNPTTLIRFALSTNTNVTLKVYDITGKEVATLLNNVYMNAGINEYTFDASNLSSGIYFYTIQAGDFKDTKKMMLIK